MNDVELNKQVEEFEYFYNNVVRLVDGDKTKPMPPLTNAQKKFVKELMRCRAEGRKPLAVSTRLRYTPDYVKFHAMDEDDDDKKLRCYE